MSPGSRFACVWVPCFVAAAVERSEPALAERPLAVVRGAPPAARVLEASAAARESGVAPGMTETEARARCPDLVSRPFSEAQAASAQHALLAAALAVSPRLEDAAPGLVHVDVTGLGRLIGDDTAVGERLAREARAVGLPARVAVAGSRTAARVAARMTAGRVVVVPPGGEGAMVAGAPLATLELSPAIEETFARWGVRTLGELARLPRAGLAARLGPAGLRAHDLALGHDPDPFRPWLPSPFWNEAEELDWEITDLEALGAVLGRVLERLTARLGTAHLGVDALDVRLRLASGARHARTIALAHPARESGPLLALARADLAARPPAAAVTGVAVSAQVVRVIAEQGRLGQPPPPRRRDLAALAARLAALVGAENFGSPRLLDSHRPDAITLVPFGDASHGSWCGAPGAGGGGSPGEWGSEAGDPPPPAPGAPAPGAYSPLMLRRLRPSPPVAVTTAEERPVSLRWQETVHRVIACAGPWRASGEWWDTGAWGRDEWDLHLDDGTLCRLARDHVTGTWTIDAIYD